MASGVEIAVGAWTSCIALMWYQSNPFNLAKLRTATIGLALLSAAPVWSEDSQIIRMSVSALPAQVGNPYRYTGYPAQYITTAIFDALTSMSADGTPEPALALSWERTSPLVWHFNLRPDVVFSNGKPLNATAVVKAVEYVTSSQASVESIRVNLADLAGARVIDDLTVEITTKRPNLFFPRLMSELKIVEPSQWALGRDAFALNPVGTGPFEVTSFSANGIKLKAFRTAWRAPKAMGLEIQSIPDGVSRVQALLSGKTDIALLLGPEDIEPVEAAGNRMLIYPTGGVFVVGFITEQAKTAARDVRVRQALNYAVDKEAIVNGLLAGHSRPASQVAPQVAFGFDGTIAPYPYDPARARKLLADAGYSNGLVLLVEAVTGTVAGDAAILQKVAADLADVGVTMNIRTTTFQAYSRHYVQGDWEGDGFAILYATDPYLDGLKPLQRHSCAWIKPWYCDRDVMSTFALALEADTVEERRVLTHQVMRRYHDQAAAIFLAEVSGYAGLTPRVKDLEIVNTVLRLEQVWLKD